MLWCTEHALRHSLRSSCLGRYVSSAGTGALRLATARFATGAGEQPAGEKKFPAMNRGLKLNIDEALYLAKEAGIFTTQEVQLQIIRSPPFSPREHPFLLENFYEVIDDGDQDEPEELFEEDALADDADSGIKKGEDLDKVHPAIHGTIQKHFRSEQPKKFWHNGQEWLCEAEGYGTRKRAAAHAVLRRGSGLFKVNGETDVYSQWPQIYNRFDVCQPFKLTGTACAYDVFVDVRGGGPGGQAGAARLAVSRALLMANPACHDDLQKGYCLLEDTRQKLSKRSGKKSAHGSFSWSKR